MYILKNALISITRNKGRNILLGIVIVAIACASAVTLAIKNSANNLVSSYSDSFELEASISMDRQQLMGQFKPGSDNAGSNSEIFNNISKFTVDDIKNYANSSYVKDYYYIYSVGMNSSNIEKASNNDSNMENFPGDRKGNDKMISSSDFTVTGYSSYSAMSEFIDGLYIITEGEVSGDFTFNNCVINSELATFNNLSVGDVIILVNPNDSSVTYNLTITGIFDDKDDSSDNPMSMFSNSANMIITNSTVVDKMLSDDSSLSSSVTPTFILIDKEEDTITDFETELYSKGLSEYYKVSTNLDSISNGSKAINNLSNYASSFLMIVLLVGGIVLLILNMINVRERKYEIGVLRTMGMKKVSVISQFVLELLMVSVVGLVIGTGIGAIVSVPTANALLENEIESSKESLENVSNNFGKGGENKPGFSGKGPNSINMGVVAVNEITSINAVVNFKVLFQILAIGLSLTVISSAGAMLNISKFSPLTILKERT